MSPRKTSTDILVVSGLGNAVGTGASVARLFAAELGYRVALVARPRRELELLRDEINQGEGGEVSSAPQDWNELEIAGQCGARCGSRRRETYIVNEEDELGSLHRHAALIQLPIGAPGSQQARLSSCSHQARQISLLTSPSHRRIRQKFSRSTRTTSLRSKMFSSALNRTGRTVVFGARCGTLVSSSALL